MEQRTGEMLNQRCRLTLGSHLGAGPLWSGRLPAVLSPRSLVQTSTLRVKASVVIYELMLSRCVLQRCVFPQHHCQAAELTGYNFQRAINQPVERGGAPGLCSSLEKLHQGNSKCTAAWRQARCAALASDPSHAHPSSQPPTHAL